ncbi:MFS transporter [Candidatus Latescibacterota bacterium]
MKKFTDPSQDNGNPRSWRITVAVMFTAQFLSGVGFSFVLPFFPFYFRFLGVDNESDILLWMGWSSLAFGITMTFSAPLWGLVADRYGRKLMVIRSMLAGSIILGLMGLATNPWHLLILRICQGAATGTVAASVTLVSSITPSANLGISLGLMQTALFLGAATGPLFGGVLAEHYGFRLPCGLAFIILFFGTILVFLGARERFVPPRKSKTTGITTIKNIIHTAGFKTILLIFFFIYVLRMMITPILPLYIEMLSGKSSGAVSLTGIFVGITALLMGISSFVLGRLGDILGHERILILSLIMSGIFSIPQSFANSITVLFIEMCLLGLVFGGLITSVNTLVSNMISKEKIGSAYGLTGSVTCLGIGMGPFIGGTIASVIGLRWPFAIMGITAFMMAVFVWKTLHKRVIRSSVPEKN